jgi:4-hydroxybenzoate polyprenyltransferase
VTGAVLTGQLTIGWGNDLRDARRDRQVGRTDKPLATGELSPQLVVLCLVVAAVLCVGLSFAVGWRSALVNIVLGMGSGHAYNLGLKSTAFSWLPYALAFGTLPAVVTLAGTDPALPPWWMAAAAAALGVGAHFLNTLPDLAADAATGVRGLPHRIGAGASRAVATILLVAASGAAVLGPDDRPTWGWAALAGVLLLAVAALRGRGRRPFQAALLIALVDVVLLVVA